MNLLKDVRDLLWQLVPRRYCFPRYSFSQDDLYIKNLNHTSFDPNSQMHLDILTYNVEYTSCQSQSRSKSIVRAIEAAKADIVCLQETNPEWEKELQLLLPSSSKNQYPYRYFHHPTRRPAGGSAFLSNYPITDIHVIDSSEKIKGSVFATLVGSFAISTHKHSQIDTTNLVKIANVHLRPPVELDGSASLSTARTTGLIRKHEIREILTKHPNVNMIVGDFNENDNCHSLRSLSLCASSISDHTSSKIKNQTIRQPSSRTERLYEDALQQFVPFYKETHRWPFFHMTLYKRLDHIVYRKDGGWTCHGCGIISGHEEGASDHQPVLARFCCAS